MVPSMGQVIQAPRCSPTRVTRSARSRRLSESMSASSPGCVADQGQVVLQALLSALAEQQRRPMDDRFARLSETECARPVGCDRAATLDALLTLPVKPARRRGCISFDALATSKEAPPSVVASQEVVQSGHVRGD